MLSYFLYKSVIWTRQKSNCIGSCYYHIDRSSSFLQVHFLVHLLRNIFMHLLVHILLQLHKCYTLTILSLAGINIIVHAHVYNWVKSMILISHFDLYLFHFVYGSLSLDIYLLSIYMYEV